MGNDNFADNAADGDWDAAVRRAGLDTPDGVRRLRAAGEISSGTFVELLKVFRPAVAWQEWLRAHLLVLGWALILAGVICVFAHNYAAMGKFAKLLVLQSAVVAAVAVTLWRGAASLAGKVALCIGAVLVGVLLAVFGQIYQTGADAWQLFALWMGLITLWAVAGRTFILWLIWLTVASVALALFYDQFAHPQWQWDEQWLGVAYTVIFGIALLIAETVNTVKQWWQRSARWLLLLLTLIPVTVLIAYALSELIFDGKISHLPWVIPGTVLWCAVEYAGLKFYCRRRPDILALILLTLSVTAIVVTGICSAFVRLEQMWHNGVGLILAAVAVLGVSWLWLRVVQWLKKSMPAATFKEMEADDGQEL